MTTSGDINYNPAVTEIITQALFQLGVNQEDEAPTASQYKSAIFQLNAIVTTAQATGLHVWTEEEAILFLQPGQERYEIGGPDPVLNAHTSDADDWQRLVLQAVVLPGDFGIFVDDASAVVLDQNIGVIQDDHTTYWSFVTFVDYDTNYIEFDGGLTETASTGNYVLIYSTAINRPLKVPSARLLYLQGLNEIPMTINSRQEYMDTPNKFTVGPPTQFFYSPRRDKGLFYVWPVPTTTQWAVRFTWYRPLEDFLYPDNTMDFPREWISPLIWILAKDLMGVYDTPPQRQQYIMAQANAYGDLATSYDRESEPIQFGYDFMGGS